MKITNSHSMNRRGCLGMALLLGLGFARYASAQTDADKTYVYRCGGEDSVIVVTLQGDKGYFFSRQVSQAIRKQAQGEAWSGEQVNFLPLQQEGLAAGQSAQIEIAGRKLPDCKNDPRAAVWEAAKLRGVSFRAVGQEPGWILEIHRDEGFLLVTDYGQSRHSFPYTEPVSDAQAQTGRYSSESGGEAIEIVIGAGPCRDSMSGEEFSSRVEVDWRGQTLRGCGRALH